MQRFVFLVCVLGTVGLVPTLGAAQDSIDEWPTTIDVVSPSETSNDTWAAAELELARDPATASTLNRSLSSRGQRPLYELAVPGAAVMVTAYIASLVIGVSGAVGSIHSGANDESAALAPFGAFALEEAGYIALGLAQVVGLVAMITGLGWQVDRGPPRDR